MAREHALGEDVPAARQESTTRWCPFCGGSAVLISVGDRPDDPMRMELYCDNTRCDVREFAVLALRANGEEQHRADLLALRTVDEGTSPERQELGKAQRLHTPEDLQARAELHLAGADDPVRRRTRPSYIEVRVAPDWRAAWDAHFGEPRR